MPLASTVEHLIRRSAAGGGVSSRGSSVISSGRDARHGLDPNRGQRPRAGATDGTSTTDENLPACGPEGAGAPEGPHQVLRRTIIPVMGSSVRLQSHAVDESLEGFTVARAEHTSSVTMSHDSTRNAPVGTTADAGGAHVRRSSFTPWQ
jgi:hypothetical protein